MYMCCNHNDDGDIRGVVLQSCDSRGSSECTDYNDWIIIDDSKQDFVAKPFHIDEVLVAFC